MSFDGFALAKLVRSGAMSAASAVEASLSRIASDDPTLTCFTAVLADRARQRAEDLDVQLAAGVDIGPLAGVPFAAKNLYDVAGLATLAGSKIYADHPPATSDAPQIKALEDAGAVLVGTTNMDEFAYGFVTENIHHGTTRNPWDIERIAGGSSGGSAAAVAGGLVPLSLGSDTNGSVRLPAGLCGIYGLKPTYGRISRRGMALFVSSFDHAGIFARSTADIATSYDLLHGPDPLDPVASERSHENVSGLRHAGIGGLRIAVVGGYFAENATAEALDAVTQVARALGAGGRSVEFPDAAAARAAAFVITASEGACLHLPDLSIRPQDFDPATRDRFYAGALIPAQWVNHAQRFRSIVRRRVMSMFQEVDVLLAPASPCPALKIGQTVLTINGQEVPARPHLGLYTQPLSFVGLPVLTVPVTARGKLPLGVQLIAAPYREDRLVRVAQQLEDQGVIAAPAVDFRDRAGAA